MQQHGISIVIPAFNEEKFLPATLAAIKIAQSEFARSCDVPTEVIVVNNASTDQTVAVATEAGARVVEQPLRNIAAVRNAGIQSASFDLVVTIDADSFLPPDALLKIFEVMRKGDVVGGALGVVVVTDRSIVRLGATLIQWLVARISGISGAMFFFARTEALEIGGFPENRLVAEDSAFAIALREYGKSIGKGFVHLRTVKVGTLDRKPIGPTVLLPAIAQVAMGFLGRKQTPGDLKYWYDPKR